MDKELYNKEKFDYYSKNFREYLNVKFGLQTCSFLEDLASFGEIIIFSGVIRNFFLKFKGEERDLDLVFISKNQNQLINYLNKFNPVLNSFGGYKIALNKVKLDIWELDKTWALLKNKVTPELFNIYNLPNTTFFNFSAIVYDYNNKNFIITPHFIKFLETKEMDLVLKENPMPALCIVNTIYYKTKYNLNIAKNLKKFYVDNFFNFKEEDYNFIQRKHFSEVIYSYEYLLTYFKMFHNSLYLN